MRNLVWAVLVCGATLGAALPASAQVELGLRGTSLTSLVYDTNRFSGALGAVLRFSGGPVSWGVAVEGGEQSGFRDGTYKRLLSTPAVLGEMQWRLSDGLLQPWLGGSVGFAIVEHTDGHRDMSQVGTSAMPVLHPAAGLRLALPVRVEVDVGTRVLPVPSFAARLALLLPL